MGLAQPITQRPPDNILNDYWAPDREEVLRDPSRWGPAPSSPGTAPPPPSSGYQAPSGSAPTGTVRNDIGPMNVSPQTSTAPAGFDQTKWSDPNKQSPKYVSGRILAGGGTIQDVAAKLGGYAISDDVIEYYNPELRRWERVDIIKDVEGSADPRWGLIGTGSTREGITSRSSGGSGSVGPSYVGGHGIGTGVSGSATSGAPGGATQSGFLGDVRNLLMQQLGQLSQPVGANDPLIQGEMQAQERLLERNRQDRRSAAAERMAFQGLNPGGQGSGAFDAEIAAGFEDKGAALSGLQAQLYSREMLSRRQNLTQMLSMALQSGDNEAARALQLQIAKMDEALRRAGLSESARQFNLGLGAQYDFREADMDRAAMLALLGG